ncbi:MAG: amidase, partial [Myxococcota bacterium]
LEVLLHEFPEDLEAYLAGVDGLDTLQDVIDFNARHAATELRWFGQDLFERAEARRGIEEAAYRAARDTSRRTYAGFIDGRVAEHDLQAIVTPTAGPAFPIDLVYGDGHAGSSSHLTAVSGYPAVTVPMGVVEDLPVGLSFVGPAFTEGRLLAYAHAYERATRHRPVPQFLRTVGESAPPD